MTWESDYTSDSAKAQIARATEQAQKIREQFKLEKPRKKIAGFPYRLIQADRDSEDARARSRYLDNQLRIKLGMPALPIEKTEAPPRPQVRVGNNNPPAGDVAIGKRKRRRR